MKHEVIWNAVDNLAKSNKMSVSKMAKTVGLDPTTFNKSKRIRKDGKNKWPSLMSLNKLLNYFEISFDDFCKESALSKFSSLPLIQFSLIKKEDIINNNSYISKDTQEMGEESLENLDFAIRIDTDKFSPIYKYGSTIIVTKNQELRRNDRVLIFSSNKVCNIYEFIANKSNKIEFINLSDSSVVEVDVENILLIKRIIWASQ